MAVEDWKLLVEKKQAEVSAQIPSSWRLAAEYTDISETASKNVLDIPRLCGIMTPKQLNITENHDATSLLRKIHRQELSAFEVTEAFCIRAAIAQQVVCPFTIFGMTSYWKQFLTGNRHDA
jgi:Tfp pilus assembly protein PilO